MKSSSFLSSKLSTFSKRIGSSFTELLLSMKTKAEPRLVLDMDGIPELPSCFRTAQVLGLHASGSGQFSIKSYERIMNALATKQKVCFVDLRQESHGFANAMAVSWYGKENAANFYKSLDEITRDEVARLEALCSEPLAYIYSKKPPILDTPFSVAVTSVSTEEEFIVCEEHDYVRIPVTDHLAPTPKAVDEFVALVCNRSEQWLHIHCRKGKGRTTTFLAMLDMMRHAKELSFDEIIRRSRANGGSDILYIPKKRDPRHKAKVQRVAFLHEFYQYCKTSDSNFTHRWSQWRALDT